MCKKIKFPDFPPFSFSLDDGEDSSSKQTSSSSSMGHLSRSIVALKSSSPLPPYKGRLASSETSPVCPKGPGTMRIENTTFIWQIVT